MIVLIVYTDSKRAQYRVDIRRVSGYKAPAGSGFELLSKFMQALRGIGGRIDTHRDQPNIFADFFTKFLLHSSERRSQRPANRRAGREDKVNCHHLIRN